MLWEGDWVLNMTLLFKFCFAFWLKKSLYFKLFEEKHCKIVFTRGLVHTVKCPEIHWAHAPCLSLPLLLFCSKFWTRNRPGDKMRDRYNLNLLPGMSEDGVEYGEAPHIDPSLRWDSLL